MSPSESWRRGLGSVSVERIVWEGAFHRGRWWPTWRTGSTSSQCRAPRPAWSASCRTAISCPLGVYRVSSQVNNNYNNWEEFSFISVTDHHFCQISENEIFFWWLMITSSLCYQRTQYSILDSRYNHFNLAMTFSLSTLDLFPCLDLKNSLFYYKLIFVQKFVLYFVCPSIK